MMSRYRHEIIAVLAIKIILILIIKMIWFSDRQEVSSQTVADRLLSPSATASVAGGSKEHP
ncbi:cytochrome oxidase putative small subunit CydP [Paludibacterium purpuratum]|uniref:Uncharacterized protein n=1 Tax=Paludibacterium purpuratum TaxID=1144873 RepID=A0A4R7B9D9_9NEIS|nr:cytochrome oxidase putative small subunit CydP [Paludibacterium purpuratum]TDR81484.1 hypothetical protein DFP86_103137 [Paludibacterium purpuratum]